MWHFDKSSMGGLTPHRRNDREERFLLLLQKRCKKPVVNLFNTPRFGAGFCLSKADGRDREAQQLFGRDRCCKFRRFPPFFVCLFFFSISILRVGTRWERGTDGCLQREDDARSAEEVLA